jgi:ADP-ribosylglycohydrolase
MTDRLDRLTGVLLGTAVGDALGLPREGLSRRRAERMFGPPPLRHRFMLGRGMTSDDTEHTCLVGQALLRQPDDPDAFARALAWGLRFWLLGLPAGLGSATLRGVLKLWLGFPPHASGVWSAGNGPAMRAAPLGVCLGDDPEKLRAYVRASTRLTHRDPRAERGALLVAVAAHHGATRGPAAVRPADFFAAARAALPDADDRLLDWLRRMEEHLARDAPAAELAADLKLGRGVTGYVYHTVPLALYGWLRRPADFRGAVEEVIALGGDTDTTGAITGALAGATAGAAAIPHEWLGGLLEWPRSVAWMRTLAGRLAEQYPGRGEAAGRPGPLPLFWPGLLARNALFFALVLLHALRRLLPPY